MRPSLALALLLAPSAARAKAPDWTALGRNAVAYTKDLVRLDTSNPPGNEILAARWFEGVLKKEGVPAAIFTSTGTRSSVVARLKGDGTKRPLLLICHTDVVPVERKDWTVDPFAAVEKDGYLYGRGAADMKGACAANLAVFLALKRGAVPLARDVIFLGHADEESGEADRHAVWLTANHWDALDAEYGINEGGFAYWKEGRLDALDVQCAEKRYVDLKLVAKGTPGHASIPNASNAVHALARAVARLSEWVPAYSLSPLAAATVKAGAADGPEPLRAAAAGLTGADPAGAAARVAALSPELGSLLRDTCAATILSGGYKSNVVPAEAEASVNCRLLPGRDLTAFLDEVRRVIAEPAVEVRYLGPALSNIPEMPFEDPFITALKAAVAESSPGAGVRAFLSPWSTDSEVFRSRGVKVYGVDPALAPGDKDRIHGNDERIPTAALEAYAGLLYRLTVRLAAR